MNWPSGGFKGSKIRFPLKPSKENQTVAAILAWLSYRKDLFYWRQNVSAGIASSGRWLRSGAPGTPDILVVQNGRLIGLEVKSKTGKLSGAQKAWGERLEKAGGIYAVVRSVEEAEQALAQATSGPGFKARWGSESRAPFQCLICGDTRESCGHFTGTGAP